MPVFNRLIRPNGTVRIEALAGVGRDDSGGSVETYVTVEDNVPVLISQLSGNRDGRFASRLDKLTGTCTGESRTSTGRTRGCIFTRTTWASA